MEQHETKPRMAQAAEEEIKNHGDQLAKQVRAAAGEPPEQDSDEHEKNKPED